MDCRELIDDERVWGLVFRYLSNIELFNMIKVSRSWKKMVYYEIGLRGPIAHMQIIMSNDPQEDCNKIQQDFMYIVPYRSCLQIFCNLKRKDSPSDSNNEKKECICHKVARRSKRFYLIWMETYLNPNNTEGFSSTVGGLYLPKTSNTQFTHFTFIEHDITKGHYTCLEARFNCENDLNQVKFLRDKMKPFFNTDGLTRSCLLILSTFDYNFLYSTLLTIKNWFPHYDIPSWGGVTDKFSMCNYSFKKHSCKISPEFILIFVSNVNLKTWTIILDEDSFTANEIERRLQYFKKYLTNKLHMIGLMHISMSRYENLDTTDEQIFRKVFPDMMLFVIQGDISLGETLTGLLHKLYLYDVADHCCKATSIMILGYD